METRVCGICGKNDMNSSFIQVCLSCEKGYIPICRSCWQESAQEEMEEEKDREEREFLENL